MSLSELFKTDRREYHRRKTQEHKEQRLRIGVKNYTIEFPMRHEKLVKAYCAMVTAKEMLAMIASGDEEQIALLGDLTPRAPIDLETLDAIRDATRSEATSSLCDRIEDLLRSARRDRAAAMDHTDIPSVCSFYLAREYAVLYYVKGLVWQLDHAVSSGDVTLPTPEIDAATLKAKPDVL